MKGRFAQALAGISMILLLAGCSTDTNGEETDSDEVIHIGYQKFGTLNILKTNESLDEALLEKG